jgi:hypothetical protein
MLSTRMGTREAIRRIRGAIIIEGSGVEIDEQLLSREVDGLTDRGFDPYA